MLIDIYITFSLGQTNRKTHELAINKQHDNQYMLLYPRKPEMLQEKFRFWKF